MRLGNLLSPWQAAKKVISKIKQDHFIFESSGSATRSVTMTDKDIDILLKWGKP